MAKPCLLRLHFATFCGHCKRFAVAKLYIFWGSTKPADTFPTRFTLIPFYHPRCTCKSVDSRHPTTLLSVGGASSGNLFRFCPSESTSPAYISCFCPSASTSPATFSRFSPSASTSPATFGASALFGLRATAHHL